MAKKINEQLDFINPFDNGVNYEMFLASIPEGVEVAEHLKDKISNEQIEWLLNDLEVYKQSKNK